MGGRLIRRWWGERRDTESDWFTIWISASTDVQSWGFLLGLSCRFNSSLYQCVHMHVCVGVHMCLGVCVCVCVCVCVRENVCVFVCCSAGGRQGGKECVWLVYSWTAEDSVWPRDTWQLPVLQRSQNPAEPIIAMVTACESHSFSYIMTHALFTLGTGV